MRLTDKQQRAVYTDDKNILVSAAAGSGKTSVLSMRIARQISEGADIRRMLVCTFTNLAAAEMRERIAKRLLEQAEETGSLRMRAQAEYASSADICTIHSFCLKLVRENYLLLGLPPLHIAGEQLQKTLFTRAMDETFDELSEADDESFTRLAKRYVNKSERDFKELLSEIYEFAMTMEDGLEWIAGLNNKSAFERLRALYGDKLRRDAQKAAAYYDVCQKISKRNFWKGQNENDVFEYSAAVRISDSVGDENEFKTALADAAQLRRKSGLKPDSEAKLHKAYKEKARKALRELAACANNDISACMMIEEDYMLAQAGDIYNVLSCLDRHYSQAKLEKGVATFDDILRYAYNALNSEALAQSWRERYDYVFVDEYQDTNPIQDAIIERVSKENNRFMVGDIKQSIYRFRLADPLIFRKKQDEYEGKTTGVELIRMNDNFRSSSGVTDKINSAMSRLMSRDFGEIDYIGGEELIANCGSEGSSELIITQAGDHDLHEADAETVSKRIEELHRAGTAYSDMAVLLTSANVQGTVYKAAMEKRGIPCDSTRDKLNSDESELFVNLLRIIDSSNSDIALLSVMRSHIGGFDENELAEIRASSPNTSFFDAVLACCFGKTGKKCMNFLEKLKFLRICEKSMELRSFLIFIKQQTMFEETIRVLPGGEKRAEDFERFFSECMAEAAEREGLFDLVTYFDELKRTGEPYMTASAGGRMRENAVHIMTVHASKGLEFPVVFFSCLHKGMNRRSINAKKILYNAKLGIVTDIYDENTRIKTPGILKDILKDFTIAEGKSEFLRLCYVAMTRAKKKLILTGAVKDKQNFFSECGLLTKELAALSDDPLTWLTWAYNRGNGEFDIDVREVMYEQNESSTPSCNDIKNILTDASKLKTAGFFASSFEQLPLKVGVSSLLPEYNPEESGSRRRNYEKGGAEFGTLIHLFMEHADFHRFEGVYEQTERMNMALLITEKEQELILSFKKCIENFMSGEIAERICSAQRIMREVPFNISVRAQEIGLSGEGNVLVQGIIDLLLFEGDNLVIVDYKSNYADADSIPVLAEHYRIQMKLYKKAVELIANKPVSECILCFMRAGKTVTVS